MNQTRTAPRTTSFRPIEGVYRGSPFYWVGNGFHVSNYFPSGNPFGQRMSPFYLLDYHAPRVYAPTDDTRRGVGVHPHRGMETVSVAYDGAIAHHDSADNAGVIHPGDQRGACQSFGYAFEHLQVESRPLTE